MAKRDYYECLELTRTATDGDIKKAYRRLAMKFHPDRNPNDKTAEAKFKEIKEAYEVLCEPQKRAAYDQFGHAGVEAQGGGGGGFHGGAGGFADIFGDVFSDIFGGGRRGGGAQVFRGADLRYNLELELEDAVRGTEVRIRVPKLERCETCNGSGAKPGTSPQGCPTCGGAGQVRMQQGFFSIQQTCPNCRGAGRIVAHACSACQGQGRVRQAKMLSVKVPAGVDEGDQIRLTGEGEAGENGGPHGDLYVVMRLKPHALFKREQDDLYCEVPVSFATAALGGELEVPTLAGRASLKIPAETQSDKVFRLRGKGVKNVRSGQIGDLYCRVTVETPVNLNKRQKELLQEFAQSLQDGGSRHSPREQGWVEKVKNFFG